MPSSLQNVKPGDRIMLTKTMVNDPAPVEAGTQGIVTSVNDLMDSLGIAQVGVRWDNGRTLMLALPDDEFIVLTTSRPALLEFLEEKINTSTSPEAITAYLEVLEFVRGEQS